MNADQIIIVGAGAVLPPEPIEIQRAPLVNRNLVISRTHYRAEEVPQIRLQGAWLRAAGFPPGARVNVIQTGKSIIEVRLQEVGK